MNDINIEEYEKVKPKCYFVRYKSMKSAGFSICTEQRCVSFLTMSEAEDYAKKIRYARSFLGDELKGTYYRVEVGSFDEQFNHQG